MIVNVPNFTLRAPAANRQVHGATHPTGDVQRRACPALDLDPVRLAVLSSTDAERAAARERAQAIQAWLRAEGWPPPLPAHAANGAHRLAHPARGTRAIGARQARTAMGRSSVLPT